MILPGTSPSSLSLFRGLLDRAGLARCLGEAIACDAGTRRAMGQRARQAVEGYASLPRVLERLVEVYRGDAGTPSAPLRILPRGGEG